MTELRIKMDSMPVAKYKCCACDEYYEANELYWRWDYNDGKKRSGDYYCLECFECHIEFSGDGKDIILESKDVKEEMLRLDFVKSKEEEFYYLGRS